MSFIKTASLSALAALVATAASAASLHKDPRCGCCGAYADYMREQGYELAVMDSFDVVAMSVEAGIPADMQGCHLIMIEGYAVSGHVPVAAVEKLLAERPEIDGLTLPGMPLGSPGMSGDKDGPFEILALENGEASLFMRD